MLTNAKAGGIRFIEILCIEYKAGVWGHSPSPPEANGCLGGVPDAAAILQLFSKKIRIF